MSVAVLILLAATVVAAIGLLVTMFARKEPYYGAMGLFVLIGPSTVLTFVYVALAGA
jgi:hypothetical protein